MFNRTQIKIVEFCAEECRRQESGEVSVARMVRAYSDACEWSLELGRKPDETYLMMLANAIEPVKNRWAGEENNYRRVTVSFANGNLAIDPYTVPFAMGSLMLHGDLLMKENPEGWVHEFLRIHPFLDGNGRVAAIVWNWLNGTLKNPVVYPEQDWSQDARNL